MMLLRIILLLFCLIYIGGCALNRVTEYETPPDDQMADSGKVLPVLQKGRFVNPFPPASTEKISFSPFRKQPKRLAPKPSAPIPIERVNMENALPEDDEGLYVTWFGHSSFLLQIDGVRILVDPVFTYDLSPVPLINSRRFFRDLPFEAVDLPYIDAVFISHSHMDHLDKKSIRALSDKVGKFIVPIGVGRLIGRWGVDSEKISEFSWWEGGEIEGQSGQILEFVCTPAYHSAMRAMVDANKTLWASWTFVGSNHRVFFSGDTAYSFHFKQIGYHFGPFDLTLLENGQYMEESFVYHLEPEETLMAHADLRGRYLFPHHWATYDLARHDWYEPIERIIDGNTENVPILTPRIGQTLLISEEVETDNWWREVMYFDSKK